MFRFDPYCFLQVVLGRTLFHSKGDKPSGELLLLERIVTWQTLKETWSSVCVCVCLRAAAESKQRGAGQLLTIWQWHCTCAPSDIAAGPAHVLHLPSDHVRPKLGREDVVKQNKRAFTAMFHTFLANQQLPCLETQCAVNNSDKVTKLTKAGIKNQKPFVSRDRQD